VTNVSKNIQNVLFSISVPVDFSKFIIIYLMFETLNLKVDLHLVRLATGTGIVAQFPDWKSNINCFLFCFPVPVPVAKRTTFRLWLPFKFVKILNNKFNILFYFIKPRGVSYNAYKP